MPGRWSSAAAAPAAALVITPTRGLLSPNTHGVGGAARGVRRHRHRRRRHAATAQPLERDLGALVRRLAADARVVLLGSIASDKYLDVLAPALGERLHYPPAFIGRGDMSRGGLLLRSAASGVELDYAPLTVAIAATRQPAAQARPARLSADGGFRRRPRADR